MPSTDDKGTWRACQRRRQHCPRGSARSKPEHRGRRREGRHGVSHLLPEQVPRGGGGENVPGGRSHGRREPVLERDGACDSNAGKGTNKSFSGVLSKCVCSPPPLLSFAARLLVGAHSLPFLRVFLPRAGQTVGASAAACAAASAAAGGGPAGAGRVMRRRRAGGDARPRRVPSSAVAADAASVAETGKDGALAGGNGGEEGQYTRDWMIFHEKAPSSPFSPRWLVPTVPLIKLQSD